MIRFLYQKWILGKCRHICLFCEFRKEYFDCCFSELQKRDKNYEKKLTIERGTILAITLDILSDEQTREFIDKFPATKGLFTVFAQKIENRLFGEEEEHE